MKKYIIYGSLLLVSLSLSGCQKQIQAPELLEPVGVEMDTAVVQSGDMYSMSVYNGEVVPYVEEVSFAVDGKIKEFFVAVGDTVEKGQLLAKLDDEDLCEKIEDLESEENDILMMGTFSDRKMAAEIEIEKEQLEVFWERKVGDKDIKAKQLEIELLELELAENQELRNLELSRLRKKIQALKEEVSQTQLTAPISGKVVYLTQVAEGDLIQSLTTAVCIADENQIHISSEYISPSLMKGAYHITAQVLEKDYDIVYEPFEDSEYLSMVLSGEKMKSRFSLKDESTKLVCGQYAAIKIWNYHKENVLTIPANALYRDEKGRYVYKIVDEQRVRCNVTIGITNEIKVEILEGLQEGDVVYVKE